MTAGNGALVQDQKIVSASNPKASNPKTGVSDAKGMGVQPVEEFYQRYQSFKENKAPAIEKEEIKKVFDFFDENKDGLISKEDLRLFMSKLGFNPTDDEISSMVSSVDSNGDGSVDFDEFSSLYQTITSSEDSSEGLRHCEEEDLKEAFNVFDTDKDGFISPTELQAVLVNLGMKEGTSLSNCEMMIKNVDADGNGRVDFTEFKKLMSSDFIRG
ncbi:calcium-binding protein CML [Marchantia polymorpha subsp. ruderalis]|nr:hypothetical protein MARPO_0097s0037 [Marchantia polymorpha]BBN13759.1 hypothetical protein Mp_6g06060 [Marchantia polymorpha subsp. ruderalis]|eukprot:PTQ32552.1 hypothetical protein MARPO_0097s0037 [Marchantia polymorpha]